LLARGGDNFGEEVTTREVEGHRQQHRCGKVKDCLLPGRPYRNEKSTIREQFVTTFAPISKAKTYSEMSPNPKQRREEYRKERRHR